MAEIKESTQVDNDASVMIMLYGKKKAIDTTNQLIHSNLRKGKTERKEYWVKVLAEIIKEP